MAAPNAKFLSFLEDTDEECYNFINPRTAADDDPQTIAALITYLDQEKYRNNLEKFVQCRSDNVNFRFWWQYMEMVSALLQYTRAQRDGVWDLYLHSFQKMLPYFNRYDHLNYARWGPVYLVELPEPVLNEFQKGNFVVKRSPKSFSQVDPDQAMEWVNGTSKRRGGIIGITKTASALSRWTLSFNLRSHIAERTHQLYRLPHGSTDHHNEATKSRQTRDNDDENSLLTTLRGYNVFSSASNPNRLQSIATKDLATELIQDSLLHAKEFGLKEVEKFAQDRLVTLEGYEKPAVSIHDTMRRINAPTFATLYEVPKQTKEKDKKEVLQADRNVLRRLVTSYEAN